MEFRGLGPPELRGEPLRGYRLLERVGEGAFGIVHRALQPQVGREVAVKSIHPEFANDPEFVRRFEREAQLVARLEYPHIVPLYDYWREPEGAYLVMRFLRGGNLRARIEGEERLSPGEMAAMLDQVTQALNAAHRQGIVHRDVKPENILLDEDGNAYLSDFGIARDLSESPTRSGLVGTPAYLSPEQIRGGPVTPMSDEYALGIVLFEALSGHHPFPEGSLATLMQHHLNDPLPQVLAERPELPSAVDEVIARATAKDPSLRYADAPALAAGFRSALGTFGVTPSRVPLLEVANPYKGLRPFEEADAPIFFGRERLTKRLVARLAEGLEPARLVAVVGPSGSGKSSVVGAGLLPALHGGAVPGSAGWFYAAMLPGSHPLEELEAALLRVAINPLPSVMEQLERDERGLARVVKRVLPDDGSELLLFIDQLEELFTLRVDEAERDAFLASIASGASDPRSRLRLVLTLRADFYDRPLLHPTFGELLERATATVTPLAPDELGRAISAPAERVGVTADPALVAEMVAEVTHEPGALPLLQFTLTELFERRQDRTMTLAAYHDIGGISGALVGRAEELYDGLDHQGKEACRQLFLRLVALSEGTQDTRRRVARAELDGLVADRGAMDGAIDAFGRHRLLSFDRDPVTRGPTLDVAHESLLRSWPRLRGWIDAAREDVRLVRRLEDATVEWDRSGREPSFLLRGSRLDQFEAWAERTDMAIRRPEQSYLRASVTQREEERTAEGRRLERERALERRSVKRLHALVAVFAAAALVAGTLTVVAFDQSRKAERASRLAIARELAAAAAGHLETDRELALLLALESIQTTRADGTIVPQAEEILRRGAQAISIDTAGIVGRQGIRAIAFTPDGAAVAVGGEETGSVGVWDLRTGARVLSIPSARPCLDFAFRCSDAFSVSLSDDASTLAVGDGGGLAHVWDIGTGQEILTIAEQNPPPVTIASRAILRATTVVLSPDGELLATNGTDGALRGWDVSTGQKLWERAWSRPALTALAFSPNGMRLAFGTRLPGDGGGPGVMDVGTGRVLVFLPDHVLAAAPAFSADSSRVAVVQQTTPFSGGHVEVWDVFSGETISSAPIDFGFPRLHPLTLSPEGRLLAMVGEEVRGEIQLREAGTLMPLRTLQGHAAPITDIAFSADGTRIVTASLDGTARVWNTETGELIFTTPLEPSGVIAAAFGGGRERIATVYEDGTILVHAIALEHVVEMAQARVTRSLTDEECQTYLHVPSCPAE